MVWTGGQDTLAALRTKATTAILRHLLDAIDRYGAPRIVRTDNEAIFTSPLFAFALRLLGVRHQTTERHCPWQNGRIERFFGTLKQHLNHWCVAEPGQLDVALQHFRFFYNHVRTHQYLDGRTPAEAWNGIDPFARPRRARWYAAWDGLLTGYYFPG